jgi:hypothetical protein
MVMHFLHTWLRGNCSLSVPYKSLGPISGVHFSFPLFLLFALSCNWGNTNFGWQGHGWLGCNHTRTHTYCHHCFTALLTSSSALCITAPQATGIGEAKGQVENGGRKGSWRCRWLFTDRGWLDTASCSSGVLGYARECIGILKWQSSSICCVSNPVPVSLSTPQGQQLQFCCLRIPLGFGGIIT